MGFWATYGQAAQWIAKVIATIGVFGVAVPLLNARSWWGPLVGLGLLLAVALAWVAWSIVHIVPWWRERHWVWVCVALVALANGCTRVDPGYVGIQVYYYGAYRGEPIARGAGTIWYLPSYSTVLEYPVFQRQTAWTHKLTEGRTGVDDSLTYNSKEGLVFHADLSVAYTLKPYCVADFYRRFRTDDLDTFTHGFLRQSAQNWANTFASRYTAEELYGDKKDAFIVQVQKALNDELEPLCVHIVQMGYTEAPRPPQPIIDSINAKIAATQNAIRVENEVRQSKASAQKAIAEAQGRAQSILVEAEAQAKANALLSASITANLIQLKAIERWNGIRPLYEGTSAGILMPMPAGGK